MALYCELFARKHGGQVLLRIEDTDRTRYDANSEAEFIETLRWVGIEFDEGPHVGGPHAPYRQSERKEAGIYAEAIQTLLAQGLAYKAFDTPEELQELREFQQINKMPTGYFGGDWRDADPAKVAEAESAGRPFVIRLKIPRNEKISYQCPIRGLLEWDSNLIDDPVLIKADGMPTYHFAAMVDDHLMEITHVFRGEEWISSLPKHLVLFDAFGWEKPLFVHCPVIVGKDGKKLSKRHGATRVLDYAAEGYLNHVLQNFVALIGWAPGEDREVMTREEMIQAFSIEGIQPSPGKFDLDKLRWMNGLAIREQSVDELFSTLQSFLAFPYTLEYWQSAEANPDFPKDPLPKDVLQGLQGLIEAIKSDAAYVKQAIELEQERCNRLADFGHKCRFFFIDQVEFDEKAVEKWFGEAHVKPLLLSIKDAVNGKESISIEECESLVRGYGESNGFEKLGPVVHPLRIALTGTTTGPGLFELMSVLGPAKMSARLDRAAEMAV